MSQSPLPEEPIIEDDRESRLGGGRAPLYIALGAAFLGLLLVCVFAYFIFCPENACVPSTIAGNPTPTVIIPTLPTNQLNEEVITVLGDNTEPISLTIDIPSVLNIGGQDFAIQTGATSIDGIWQPTVNSPTTAVWLNGTIINYTLAIQNTAENQTIVTALERGDEIVLTTQSGEQRIFDFSSRNIVPASQRDVFGQTSPSITIVLVGSENSDRLVVKGRYVVEQAAQSIAPNGGGGDGDSNVAQLGDVIQLGDIQIAATLFDNRPQQGSNIAYYLVDYQVQNIGSSPIDTSQLKLTLVDSIGTTYVQNVEASAIGNHPPINPQLNVGELAQGTAGYQISSGLDYNSLAWVVERIDTGEMVEFRVSATAADEDEEVTVAILADPPQLSPDATQLFLSGTIQNQGSKTIIIDASDISFVSEGTSFFILSTNPNFPWTIGAGQNLQYRLAVQRPVATPSSIFTILNQSFQISNYQ